MQKKLLLAIVAILFIVTTSLFISDGWVYLTTSFLAVLIIAIIRRFNPGLIKITRWAKANPRKTQILITVLQIVILCVGLLVGYDLKELGYRISGTPSIVFASILSAGFLSIRFLPKRSTIAIPVAVNKDRVAYVSIILSGFVLMIITGNRVEERFPNSAFSHTIRSIDQAIFYQYILSEADQDVVVEPDNNHQQAKMINEASSMFAFASIAVTEEKSVNATIYPKKGTREEIKDGRKGEKLEKKKMKMVKKLERLRKAFAAYSTVGTVLLVILLVITTCAGICLIAIGGSAGAVAAGIFLTGVSIWGFIKLFTRNKRTKPNP